MAADSPDNKAGFRSLTQWEIIAGVVLLVAALIVVVVLLGGGDDDKESDLTATGPNATTATGGPQGSVKPPPPPPPSLEDSSEIAEDDFDRADADNLGSATTGQAWTNVVGSWAVLNGAAIPTGPLPPEESEELPFSIAILEGVALEDGSIAVTFDSVSQSAGVVFRYQDQDNYFLVSASPEYAAWGVTRVINGEVKPLGFVGLTPTDEGTELLVQTRGDSIDVFINGKGLKSFTSDDLTSATGVGIVGRLDAENPTAIGEVVVSEAD